MHSAPGEGPQEIDPDVESTVQGTLDPFLGTPKGRSRRPTAPVAGTVGPATGKEPRSVRVPMQHSIDAFTDVDAAATAVTAATATADAPQGDEAARAPRAMAGLALERAIERVAVREAAKGITRDELIIIVARECEVPLEDLTLVDSYISDLVLEGKLGSVGERIILARQEVAAPAQGSPPGAGSDDGPRTGARAGKGRPHRGRKGGG